MRSAFWLADDADGVLVVVTAPCRAAGMNGDTLYLNGGHGVVSPMAAEKIVQFSRLELTFDSDLGLYDGGGVVKRVSTIAEESCWATIQVPWMGSW